MSSETSQKTCDVAKEISALNATIATLAANNAALEAKIDALEAKFGFLRANVDGRLTAMMQFQGYVQAQVPPQVQAQVPPQPQHVNAGIASEHVTRLERDYQCNLCGVTWPHHAPSHKPNGPKCRETQRSKNTKTKFKTKLCSNWSRTGSCQYGLNCKFGHGVEDLRDSSDEDDSL